MPALPLLESFSGHSLDARLAWHCPPPKAELVPGSNPHLRVEPAAGTDFWQRTHYGFSADDGHFLHATVDGDFVLEVHVHSFPRHQYDQAGLMVRVDADCWLKTSIEFEPDGPDRLGAVVTNGGYSDWSTQPHPGGDPGHRLRVAREGDDYRVEFSPTDGSWTQLRVTHLHAGRGRPVQAGLYACSPKGPGYVAEFRQLRLVPGRHA